ncbi:MAG: YsnF/AvaK domain-containing protein [Thermomicrobiales bacterium]
MTNDPYDFNQETFSDDGNGVDVRPDSGSINLSLAEETLEAHVVERRQGKVRINTHVETQRVKAAVDLHSDDYVIEHIEINEDADERRDFWYEGDSLMIPVYEEVLVTQTQLVLREVIRLRNKGHMERVNLKGVVRRDVVDITQIDD